MLGMFGPKKDEKKGSSRNPHNEKLRDLYSQAGVIRMIKSRRTRRAGMQHTREGEDTG
jgi:hypothetical protein